MRVVEDGEEDDDAAAVMGVVLRPCGCCGVVAAWHGSVANESRGRGCQLDVWKRCCCGGRSPGRFGRE